MIEMKIQVPCKKDHAGRVTEYEKKTVIGLDLYDAWDKAIAAGHDPYKQVMWREYAV